MPSIVAEEAEDFGYFWKTAGSTRFSAESSTAAPGYASTVAVADKFGVVIFSDLQGEALALVAALNSLRMPRHDLSNLGNITATSGSVVSGTIVSDCLFILQPFMWHTRSDFWRPQARRTSKGGCCCNCCRCKACFGKHLLGLLC